MLKHGKIQEDSQMRKYNMGQLNKKSKSIPRILWSIIEYFVPCKGRPTQNTSIWMSFSSEENLNLCSKCYKSWSEKLGI